MQIFSTSHTRSFLSKGNILSEKGFTLVELLISIAIIGIITSIVLVKYNGFDSTTLLKGVAYEIALSLRDAQVKSVSVARADATNPFDSTYGISFAPGTKNYTAFRYEPVDENDRPVFDISTLKAFPINVFNIGRSMFVKEICFVDQTSPPDVCSSVASNHFDISFQRPEFKAIFYVGGYSGDLENIESMKVKVSSPNNPTNVFIVEVSKLGQISVYKE